MTNFDLISILGNISQSLYSVQHFITGLAYLLGLIFIISALMKLKAIADSRAQSSSQEKMFTPMVYMLIGAALLYLPTALQILANTAFGSGNVLTYTNYNPKNIYSSMGLIIRTAGIIWFIRGCVLVVHASQPGTQEGPKGLVFILAGILAMNFDNTVAMFNSILGYIVNFTLSVKSSQGY